MPILFLYNIDGINAYMPNNTKNHDNLNFPKAFTEGMLYPKPMIYCRCYKHKALCPRPYYYYSLILYLVFGHVLDKIYMPYQSSSHDRNQSQSDHGKAHDDDDDDDAVAVVGEIAYHCIIILFFCSYSCQCLSPASIHNSYTFCLMFIL